MPQDRPASIGSTRARAYYAVVVAASLVAAAFAALRLPEGLRHVRPDVLVAGGAALFLLCLFIHSRSFTLSWRGQRISVYPDEAVLLVAFVYLPASLIVLVGMAASVAAQAVVRKPLVKLLFTASAYTVSLGAAAFVFAMAVRVGVAPVQAALAVPLFVSVVGHVIVGAFLTLLAGESLRTLPKRPELISSMAISAVAGTTLGFLALALVGFHPFASVLILPVAYAFIRAMAAEYRHQNELAARRALARVSERLVGESDEDAIMNAVVDACREAFALRRVQVTLRLPGTPERTWDHVEPVKDERPATRVAVPLVTQHGTPIGELALTLAAGGVTRQAEDEELAGLVAGYLSIALGTSQALRSREEAEERLREVLQAARDPIVVVDGGGRILFANPVATALLGVQPERDALRAWEDVLEPESFSRLREGLARVDEAGVVDVETRELPRGRLALELGLSPLSLPDGRRGVLVLARDVTERRRLEQEALEQRELIARQERLAALGILVAGVAHEVNNPLAFMRANLELALEDVVRAESEMRAARLPAAAELADTRTGLQGALEGALRIGRITDALKVVSRSGAPERVPVDLNDIVRGVGELVRASVPGGVQLVAESAAAPVVVRGNAGELHQVLLSLTRNAIEATQAAGGRVRLRTAVEDGHGVLVVEDDGPGIAPKVRAQLFTPFHTTKPQGTGLGLSIAHTIVRGHEGDILVDTEPGAGATFKVRIPLAPPAA